MAYQFEGSKYEQTKDLSHAELKKVILADLKAQLPATITCTIREPHYGSLDVTVSGIPDIHNVECLRAEAVRDPNVYPGERIERYTPECAALLARIKSIVDAYNFDDSDSMTDYFHRRFYLDVDPHRLELEHQRDALFEKHSPLRAERRRMLLVALHIANDKLQDMPGGLPMWKGRQFKRKPAKPILRLTEKAHMGWGFEHLIGRICGEEAGRLLTAGLKRIDAALVTAPNGGWVDAPATAGQGVAA